MFSWIRNRKRSALLIAVIVIPILSGSAWRAVWLYSAAPTPTVDTLALMNEIVAAGQPAGENAWDLYYDFLVNKFQASSNGVGSGFARLEQLRIDGPIGEGAWDAIDRTPWLALIDEFSEELGMLAAAADRPRYHKPYRSGLTALDHADAAAADPPEPAWMILLPELSYLRRLALVNAGVMRAAAHAGNWKEAAVRFRVGLRFGESLTRQAAALEGLVGAGMMQIALSEAARISDEFDIQPEAAAMFIAELDSIEFSSARVTPRLLAGERGLALDAIQWTFTDNGAGDGAPILSLISALSNSRTPTPLERMSNILGVMYYPRRAHVERVVGEYFDMLIESTNDAERRLNIDRSENGAVGALAITGNLKNWLAPSLSRLFVTMSHTESRLAGVRVMMRLEQLRAATGAWPGSLEGALGAEAVDPVTGRVFEYEPLAGDPAGRAYELRLPWSGLIDGRFLAPIAVINEPRPAMSAAPTPPTPAGEIVGNDP